MISKAAGAGAGTNYTYRTWGDFPQNGSDWTILINFKQPSTPADYILIFSLFDGLTDYTDPYIFLGTDTSGTNLISLQIYDGVTFTDTTTVSLVNGDQNWAAVTYVESTNTFALYVNGSLIDSIVVDVSAINWDSLYLLGDPGAGVTGALSVAYLRAWENDLTLVQLTAEAASETAIITTGLLWQNKLQVSFDLTDYERSLNQFLGVGTVDTDTDDPLLAVIAAPRTNISPGTALDLVEGQNITIEITSVSATLNSWYKYTPDGSTKVVSLMAYLLTNPSFTCTCSVASSLANANANIFDISSLTNRPLQWGVHTGTTYYIRVSSGVASTIAVSLVAAPQITAPAGSYVINDDQAPEPNEYAPLVFMDRSTGFPINHINDFPQGEGGQILDDGNLLVSNEHNTDEVILYDSNYVAQTSIAMPGTTAGSAHFCIASDRDTQFLVAREIDNDNVKISIVSGVGVLGTEHTVAATNSFLTALGVLPDFSIAYLNTNDGANKPIKRIDLATGAYLSDLDPGVAGYGCGRDILALSTTAILVPYYDSVGTQSAIVRKYNDAGAVLATFNFDSYVTSNADILDFRLCRDYIDDTHFIAWIKGNVTGMDWILKVRVSDGAVIEETQNLAEYEGYRFFAAATKTPQRFGHSECCPIWMTRGEVPPIIVARGSGIYFLDFGKRNDTLWVDASLGTTEIVKIP